MKIHPTAEEIRVALKKKNMKIVFFEVEDQRTSKQRTYRIGTYTKHGFTTADMLTIINEHVDIFDVDAKNIDGTELVDFKVRDFDGRRSDLEFYELFMRGDFSTEETTDAHVGVFMQQFIKDFAKDIEDREVDTRDKLKDLVEVYGKKYRSIYSMIWSDEVTPPDITSHTPAQIRNKICNLIDDTTFDVYYHTLILPQVKESYPHWNL